MTLAEFENQHQNSLLKYDDIPCLENDGTVYMVRVKNDGAVNTEIGYKSKKITQIFLNLPCMKHSSNNMLYFSDKSHLNFYISENKIIYLDDTTKGSQFLQYIFKNKNDVENLFQKSTSLRPSSESIPSQTVETSDQNPTTTGGRRRRKNRSTKRSRRTQRRSKPRRRTHKH